MSLLRRNRFSEALSVPTAITPYPRQPAHTDRDVNDIWREVREKKQKIQALDGKFEALKTELITLKAEVQVREAENERIRAAAESKDDKARLQLTQAKTLREFELLLQRQEAKAQFYAAQTGAVREIFERAKTLGSDAESKNDLCKEIARVIGIIDQTCDSMGPTEEELPLQQFLDSSFAISEQEQTTAHDSFMEALRSAAAENVLLSNPEKRKSETARDKKESIQDFVKLAQQFAERERQEAESVLEIENLQCYEDEMELYELAGKLAARHEGALDSTE